MKKTWIKVRRGLLEPKHRDRLGIRIWLYLYILDNADWETGNIFDWKDKCAADELCMPLRTIREQRQQLEADGYISCQQNRRGQTITIHNWTNPREYSGKVYNPKPELLEQSGEDVGGENLPPLDDEDDEQEEGNKNLPPTDPAEFVGDIKGDIKGSSKYVTLTLYSQNHISHTEGDKKRLARATLNYFSELTRLKEPTFEKMGYFEKENWHRPIVEICEECQWRAGDIRAVMEAAVKHMDDNGLTMTCPRSIRKVAQHKIAQVQRGIPLNGNGKAPNGNTRIMTNPITGETMELPA